MANWSYTVVIIFRGTVEDTEMVDGLVLEQKISHLAGGVSSMEKAKIGLIQFCLSAPKTDVCLFLCYIINCILTCTLHSRYFFLIDKF